MNGAKSKKLADEWESMCQSGYSWPRPFRIKVYIYPAQMKMIEEISHVWKKKKRDVFFEAFQQYIGFYVGWKNAAPVKKRGSK